MYNCGCNHCNTKSKQFNLAIGDNFKNLLNTAEKAFKRLYEIGSYKPQDLKTEAVYQDLINQTFTVFDFAIQDNDMPATMRTALQEDAFLFGGLKTHAQLFEASKLLISPPTPEGGARLKPFNELAKEFDKLNIKYNQNYLSAEYEFAVGSSQMAAKWEQFADNDRYDLQYRTAADDRVRDEHAKLNRITLPKSDPFWSSYTPLNGWNCRCTVVEVLKDKYVGDGYIKDSTEAIKRGEAATTQIGKDGKNRLEIFRFNPGADKKLFPPKHPYGKVAGAKEAQEAVNKIVKIEKPLKTTKDVSNYFSEFAKVNPEYFQRGFKEVILTRVKGVNGFTDMNGKIALKKDILEPIKEGLNAIRKGEKTTFEQEKALSTMHHEMWHNANKPGNVVSLSKDGTRIMELSNEFVARNTLGDFMKKLGGNLEHPELTTNRTNTGYNEMVRKYDQLIEFAKADKNKVLIDVKKGLIEQKYNEQMEVLANAVKKHSIYDIEEKSAKGFILKTIEGKITEDHYLEILKHNEKLFKPKGR